MATGGPAASSAPHLTLSSAPPARPDWPGPKGARSVRRDRQGEPLVCVCESAARKGTVLAAGAVETRGNQMKPPLPPPIKRAGKAQSGCGGGVGVWGGGSGNTGTMQASRARRETVAALRAAPSRSRSQFLSSTLPPPCPLTVLLCSHIRQRPHAHQRARANAAALRASALQLQTTAHLDVAGRREHTQRSTAALLYARAHEHSRISWQWADLL